MTRCPASDSWLVGAVGPVDSCGHRGHAGCSSFQIPMQNMLPVSSLTSPRSCCTPQTQIASKCRRLSRRSRSLISCTNPCASGLVAAAIIACGWFFAPGMGFYVTAASQPCNVRWRATATRTLLLLQTWTCSQRDVGHAPDWPWACLRRARQASACLISPVWPSCAVKEQ